MRRDPNILKHPGLEPLWAAIHRDWRKQQFCAAILLLLGVAAVANLWRAGQAAPMLATVAKSTMIIAGLGTLAICGALYWLFRLLMRQPDWLWYEILKDSPEEVVWVYTLVTQRLPFGLAFSHSSLLCLVLQDGEQLSISIPTQQLKLVSKTLNRVLPNAEFGYSKERAEQYLGEDPLRRLRR
ncbi:MAG: hypothetical protein AAF433_03885 [Bacteroidota bacterium]